MRRKGMLARFASLLLAVVCLAALLPAAPANAIGMGNVDVRFSDVPEGKMCIRDRSKDCCGRNE